MKVIPLPLNRKKRITLPKIRLGHHCETCRHPKRAAIDLAIVAGQSERDIAARYGLSPSSVQRHRERCVPKDMAEAHRQSEIERAEYVLASSCALDRKADAIYSDAVKHRSQTWRLAHSESADRF